MIAQTYHVTGMTCGHCSSAVTKELTALDGVSEVAVNLETGEVHVTSAQPLDDEQVKAAIDEAGFAVA